MHNTGDKVTRLTADLVASAIAEGQRQHRTGRQQLELWARVGRAVSSRQTAARHRAEDALAGRLPIGELGTEEGTVFNADEIATQQWPANPALHAYEAADIAAKTRAHLHPGEVVHRRDGVLPPVEAGADRRSTHTRVHRRHARGSDSRGASGPTCTLPGPSRRARSARRQDPPAIPKTVGPRRSGVPTLRLCDRVRQQLEHRPAHRRPAHRWTPRRRSHLDRVDTRRTDVAHQPGRATIGAV
ncbi:ParD-like antitoxin of type II toxin-antitoxin system [Rhodococcus jostii]|uniref:ParD-like antitoxin of type II toxin-antitoxin system n=1 Tax=Rhodococcus jostii TaxID=132919 RepID=A0A1H4RWY4_RHOJO|nr:ParD-like antitoxin of type II toxin-antitoxin system [Rhodococcus jostii]